MNPSVESPQPVLAPQWAFRFGAALLAGIALVVVLATLDRQQRARLESTAETTAAGDVNYFKPPSDPKALPAVGASLSGRALLVGAIEEIDVRDTHLRRVAVDTANGLTIYELSAAATAEERERVGPGGVYLLKLAPNEYTRAEFGAP